MMPCGARAFRWPYETQFASAWLDEVSEIVDSYCEEVKVLEFEGNTCVAKKREYTTNLLEMLFWRL